MAAAAPAAGGAGGGGAAAAVSEYPLTNVPDKFKPLLATSLSFFAMKKLPATHNVTGQKAVWKFTTKKPTNPDCFSRFQKKLLRFDEQILTESVGIYTWILKQFEVDDKLHLIFVKTPSKQEVGALHLNMDGLTADGDVIIAGELQIEETKEGRKYKYNILSGSYSARMSAGNQEYRAPALKDFLVGLGIPKESIEQIGYIELIDPANIKLSENLQEFYTSCGMIAEHLSNSNSNSNMGGGARRSRKGRRSAYRKSRKSRKGRRTLKRGQ